MQRTRLIEHVLTRFAKMLDHIRSQVVNQDDLLTEAQPFATAVKWVTYWAFFGIYIYILHMCKNGKGGSQQGNKFFFSCTSEVYAHLSTVNMLIASIKSIKTLVST